MRIYRSSPPARQRGAGLIEVLVAVLLVSIGLLGATGMHVRSIEYTIDTEQRQMASTVASELMETMRGDTATVLEATGEPKTDLGGYGKEAGTELAEVENADCQPLTSDPAKRLGCWGARAKLAIPGLDDDLIKDHFAVGLDAASGVISITVAWKVKKGQCLDKDANEDDTYCTFTLQSRL